MSPHDTLLEWASEVGSGSWSSWKAACEALRVGPTTAAQNLSALGHVEFDWIADRFACAPTSAVLIPRSSGCVIITGARPRGLGERLAQLCNDDDQTFDAAFHPAAGQNRGPETWMIEIEMDDLDEFAKVAELNFEIDAGRQILAAILPVRLATAAEPDRPDARFPRQWLEPETLTPKANAEASEEGLWWVEEHRREIAFVRHAAEWYRVPTREHGPYLGYPDSSYMSYDLKPQTRALRVFNRAPLPPLLARAATLQSGRLPVADGRDHHTYFNIDQDLVERISECLNTYIS
jgi:hypothetical protein